MGMKVYPTPEDRRAILERRLEIAHEQNEKLRRTNERLQGFAVRFVMVVESEVSDAHAMEGLRILRSEIRKNGDV